MRRDGGGIDGIEVRPIFLPFRLEGGLGEGGFVVEEIVEAAFFDAGLVADLVDRGAVVGAGPEQLGDGIHQSFFGITGAAHVRTIAMFTV